MSRKSQLVVGLGETGAPLRSILQRAYGEIDGHDPAKGIEAPEDTYYDVLHICIPGNDSLFLDHVVRYQEKFCPRLTIVHSTVRIGITASIRNAVHSPILGRHRSIETEMVTYLKWVGGPAKLTQEAEKILSGAGFRVRVVESSEETEALKLMCLAKYGAYIAIAEYQAKVCKKLDIPWDDVLEWDRDYNEHVLPNLRRPLLDPPYGRIGGHCVLPGTRMLWSQFKNGILKEVLKCR